MWFRLPYLIDGKLEMTPAIQTYDSGLGNSRVDVLRTLSLIEIPKGSVYLAGLGLGLTTLLLASREEVTRVVVSELNKDIIDLFLSQGFDLNKIEIRHEDCKDNLDTFDFYLYDHCDMFGIDPNWKVPDRAIGKSLFYPWEHKYGKPYEKESFDSFCDEYGLVRMDEKTAKRYLCRNYLNPLLDTQWIIDVLKYQHNYRLNNNELLNKNW